MPLRLARAALRQGEESSLSLDSVRRARPRPGVGAAQSGEALTAPLGRRVLADRVGGHPALPRRGASRLAPAAAERARSGADALAHGAAAQAGGAPARASRQSEEARGGLRLAGEGPARRAPAARRKQARPVGHFGVAVPV